MFPKQFDSPTTHIRMPRIFESLGVPEVSGFLIHLLYMCTSLCPYIYHLNTQNFSAKLHDAPIYKQKHEHVYKRQFYHPHVLLQTIVAELIWCHLILWSICFIWWLKSITTTFNLPLSSQNNRSCFIKEWSRLYFSEKQSLQNKK